MPILTDPQPKFQEYAEPNVLVSTEWLQQNLGTPGLVVVESNEDVLLYDLGHIPGAIKIDWHTELNDPVQRDFLSAEAFSQLLSAKGINREDTIVFYGDKNNWWATYAFWVFKLFGHEDLRILDGGKAKWQAEARPETTELPTPTPSEYPLVPRDDSTYRVFRDQVFQLSAKAIIDVRSPEEYSGERTSAPDYPDEAGLKPGHIPGSVNIPWSKAVAADATFKSRAELAEIYQPALNANTEAPVIAYCRIGERSAHTWFVLKYLLGVTDTRNYDGSWTEWGSLVRAPIALGSEPGVLA